MRKVAFLVGAICFFSDESNADVGLISNISSVSLLNSNGTFARVFVQDETWRVALGSQQKMFVAELIESGESSWVLDQKRELVSLNNQRFNDWGIALCPNDQLSVVASFDSGNPNNSAHHWLVDSDDSLLFSGSVATASSQWQFNDPASICTDTMVAVGASIQGFSFGNWILPMIQGQVDAPFEIEPQYRLNGGALLDDGQRIFHAGIDYDTPLKINVYDNEWNWLESHRVDLLQSMGLRAYWPQGFTRLGDNFLIAFMGRDDAWGQGDRGDVFVAVFDSEWTLLEEHRLTNYASNAAMRPWIACADQTCVVSFDVDTAHAIVSFSMAATEHRGKSNADLNACGCGTGSEALMLVPLMIVFRRRRG